MTSTKLPFQFLFVFLLTCLIWSCKKSSMDGPATPGQGNIDSLAATINTPTTINVYPGITNNGTGSGRVFIKTTQVGNINIAMPMLFDTGSAGVTISAQSVFPDSLVTTGGFKFKPGQTTIQYQGITITQINVVKVYGSTATTETRQMGNIGYAKLAVGDASGSIKMLKMPILFYYQTLANGVPTNTGLGPVFGINSAANGAQGIQDSTYSFKVVSPLKYLIYNNNLTAGYKLNAISLSGCAINTPGSCLPQAIFTVGLSATDEGAYALNPLSALSQQPVFITPQGFPAFPTYRTFDPNINATVSTAVKSKNVRVLLDSGNPGVTINVSADSLNVSNNYPRIYLTTSSNSVYSYNVYTPDFTTTFNTSSSRSVFGVYLFTKFNFLEDYQNGIRGLKAN